MKITKEVFQPRYELYRQVNQTPTNIGFMAWISYMSRRYKEDRGLSHFSPIIDQNDFTEFIANEIRQ
jgi:hypothetical protein